MSHAALDAALVLCLTAGAADLLALNMVVLPATRAPAPQQLGPELVARAPAREPPRVRSELAGVSSAPPSPAPAPRPLPVAILEFEPASPRVDRAAALALAQTLDGLRDAPAIVVIGHADASGPDQLNDRLSARRAEAVARRLFASGIPKERVQLDARGEREPREQGNSRRVEIFAGELP